MNDTINFIQLPDKLKYSSIIILFWNKTKSGWNRGKHTFEWDEKEWLAMNLIG